MPSNNTILAAVAVAAVVIGVGVYLDNVRRSDPDYQHKLKEKRRAEREAKAKAQTAKRAADDAKRKSASPAKGGKARKPANKAEQEQLFMAEMTLGQDAMAAGDVEACAKHFANAIEISDRPHELFLYLQQSLPEQLFLLVAHNVDPETMRDKYFDNMPACMTDMVEIKKVEGTEDRIVLAKRDIKKGDVIAEEAPFVATFKAHAPTSDFCYQCHKQLQGKPVQCKEKCGLEHYCGTACRDKAWDEQHMIFCTKKNAKPSSPYNRLTIMTKEEDDVAPLLVGRILARVLLPAERDHMADVAHLHFNEDVGPATETQKRAAQTLRDAMREKIDVIDQVLTDESYVAMEGKINDNKISFRSTSDTECNGEAIYLLGSYFNHSCEPNIEVQFAMKGSTASYVAIRDIKAGEEVTRAYVDVEGKSKEDRAALLKKSHGFKCNCKACGAATVA